MSARPRLTGLLALVVLAMLPLVAQGVAGADPAQDLAGAEARAEQAASAVARLGAEAAAVAAELTDLRLQVEDERARLRTLEGQLALAADELEARRDVLAAAEAAEVEARQRLAEAEDELAQQDAVLRDRVAVTWMLGGDPTPEMFVGLLASSATPSDLATGLHLLDVANDAQVGVVERVTQLRGRQASLAAEARGARRTAEDARAAAAEAVEFARATRDEQASVTARLEQAEARQETLLAGLQADAARQRTVLAAAEAEADRIRAAAAAAADGPVVAGATCPVVGAVAGRDFSNDWGDPRSGGRRHEGTDIFADRGTPVVALAGGTIKARRYADEGLGGLYVSVRTGPGSHWYYSHLDTLEPGMVEGQTVREGERLGTVGNSGNARGTPPHLHIGFYVDDVAQNPYPTLAERCR